MQIAASGLSQSCSNARTMNLSRTGACLVVSNTLPVNTQLTIAFDGQPTNKARVIWSKSAGNETGTLLGWNLCGHLQPSEATCRLKGGVGYSFSVSQIQSATLRQPLNATGQIIFLRSFKVAASFDVRPDSISRLALPKHAKGVIDY